MKQVINNMKTVVAAFVLVLTLGFANTSFANNGENTNAVELKYLGNLKNQPVFQLNIKGAVDAEFMVRITDEANNVVYAEKLKGLDISKKFQLSDEALENSLLTFEVINKKDNSVTTFKVRNNTRTVQDIEIAKL
ncbi:MAG: hypothetical protein JNN29_06795 [Chitinophagaceae bacterium]|nr:hypothetical protein [Chitinophagaceae bacterium]MBN8668482.1 hypothetical protein [Chitinophagales bacterium]